MTKKLLAVLLSTFMIAANANTAFARTEYTAQQTVQAGSPVTYTDADFINIPTPGNAGGGAVLAYDGVTIDNATFSGNSTTHWGGAIYQVGGPLTINNTVFSGNSATGATARGGAISVRAEGNGPIGTVTINNTQFINNTAQAGGGAIINDFYPASGYAHQTLNIGDGVLFQNNSTTGATGGAIFNKSVLAVGDNVRFLGNSTGGWGGGAISQEAGTGDDPALLSTTIGNNVVFDSNSSNSYGGAIYNTGGAFNIGDNATFNANTAGNSGAAIFNMGTVNIGSGAKFTDNISQSSSGAIYNHTGSEINFAGDVTFSGNKAAGADNDMYNLGTLNFNGGTAVIGGGIAGTGTVNINNTATLDIGTTVLQADTVNMANGSTLSLSMTETEMGTVDAANVNIGSSASDKANLVIALSKDFASTTPVTKQLITGSVNNGSLVLANASNILYGLEMDDSFNITAARNTAEQQADAIKDAGGTSNNAATASAFLAGGDLGSASANQAADILANLAQVDTGGFIAASTAIAPESAPARQAVHAGATQQIFNAASMRMSAVAAPSSYALPAKGSVYTSDEADFSFWVQGLLNKTHKEWTSSSSSYTGNTTGLSAGIDTNVGGDFLVGLGYAYTHTNVTSLQRKTKIDGDNFFVYGQYQPGDFYVNAILNYGHSNYDENKYIPGMPITADYKLHTYSASAKTGYYIQDFLVPNIGVRYMRMHQEGYSDSSGQSVSADSSDYLAGSAGVDLIAEEYSVSHKLRLQPQANLGLVYDFVSDGSDSTVVLPNASSYEVKGERLHRLGVEAGVSVNAMIKDDMQVSLSYDGLFKEDYSSHTGMLKLHYMF
ncbi:outer membrane autotransporter protein [Elusimicrobium simillimum]|uniref:autotransporter family protein n=1 Tax=Elusimicrobium simillimum TaxID=3143438 RepID=UPI003C704A8C